MQKEVVFVHGASLRRLEDQDKRRQIRSDVIKAARQRAKLDRDRNKSRAPEADERNREAEWQLSTRHLSPRTLLSAARSDPFMVVGVAPHDQQAQEIFDYCVQDLWYQFRPGSSYATDFAQAWFPRAASNPVVMAAILFSASVHLNIRRSSPGRPNAVSLRHLHLKEAAIASIRAAFVTVGSLTEERLDELIYAILCLAVNHSTDIHRNTSPDDNNFDSPLIGAQWIDLYAGMDFDQTHFAAIVALVRRKGGIETLRAYGVGWLVHFATLMAGANTMSRPIYPPVSVDGHAIQFQAPLRLLGSLDMPRHFSRPRDGHHMFKSCGLSPNIIQTFLDMCELSQAVELCFEQTDQSKLSLLLDDRADLVYRLLSLPVKLEEFVAHLSGSGDHVHVERWFQLYDCARNASLLYVLHVIFPLPRSKAIREQTIPVIARICNWIAPRQATEQEKMLLLWATVLAACATEEYLSEMSFVHHASAFCVALGIDSFGGLCEVLGLFAWIGSACDRRCLVVWNRIKVRGVIS